MKGESIFNKFLDPKADSDKAILKDIFDTKQQFIKPESLQNVQKEKPQSK